MPVLGQVAVMQISIDSAAVYNRYVLAELVAEIQSQEEKLSIPESIPVIDHDVSLTSPRDDTV